MPNTRRINVAYPLSGQNRRVRYAQTGLSLDGRRGVYTTPRAVNVRSVGPLENRARGGSRPGLTKFIDNDFGTNILGVASVSYVNNAGLPKVNLVVIADGNIFVTDGSTVTQAQAYWTTDDGDYVISEDGDRIVFDAEVSSSNPLGNNTAFQMAENNGKLYIADSALKKFNPATGVVESVSGAPANQPLVCAYQQRIVVSGLNHMFYMCEIDDDSDWSFAQDIDDVSRPVAGHAGGGRMGYSMTALRQFKDKVLILGAADGLWAYYGNPAGDGRKDEVSPYVGPINADSIEVAPDGTVVFLSRSGLYVWQVGSESHPTPFSDVVIPEEMRDVDVTATQVIMRYDHVSRGVHLFLTPASGVGTHWWLDLDRRAFWPVKVPATMQPWAMATMPGSGYSNVVLGCKDGYLRRFSDTASDDDGTALQSDVLFGPFHVSRMEGVDGQIMEIVGALAADSGTVTWKLVMGKSAEEAVDRAESILDGNDQIEVDSSGTWVAGQNCVEYPRSRGPWAVLWLSSTDQWSYSTASMVMERLGRLR